MKAWRLLAAAALALPLAGCGSELVYDPIWRDYHPWNLGENRYYRQWEIGSNRDHIDFPNRMPGDQLVYWQWRHRYLRSAATEQTSTQAGEQHSPSHPGPGAPTSTPDTQHDAAGSESGG